MSVGILFSCKFRKLTNPGVKLMRCAVSLREVIFPSTAFTCFLEVHY
jgi:hypothetical protein